MSQKFEDLTKEIGSDKMRVLASKAVCAESAEEIAQIAAEEGIEVSAEQAQEIFAELNSDVELSVNDLDAAAGGSIWNASSCSDYAPCADAGNR